MGPIRAVVVDVRSCLCLLVAITLMAAFKTLLSSSVTAQQSQPVNRGVVELETSGTAGISVRMAEDLANLIDDGATRRVLPVVGKGSLQILIDLRYLRGIDMAIIPIDVLDYAKEQQLYPGIEAVSDLHHQAAQRRISPARSAGDQGYLRSSQTAR